LRSLKGLYVADSVTRRSLEVDRSAALFMQNAVVMSEKIEQEFSNGIPNKENLNTIFESIAPEQADKADADPFDLFSEPAPWE
jgi:hypothetical protein